VLGQHAASITSPERINRNETAERMLSQRIAAFAEAAVDPAAPDHATARQEVGIPPA